MTTELKAGLVSIAATGLILIASAYGVRMQVATLNDEVRQTAHSIQQVQQQVGSTVEHVRRKRR